MNPTISLPSGETVPRLGQGTWKMGGRFSFKGDVAALREGIDLGMTLIDTAEMYGAAEDVCGEAIDGQRDKIFLVSKVQPHNAHRRGVMQACERSLKKNKTDRFDLYLLHWPSSHPIEETVEAFEQLVRDGKIRYWGVSNFDLEGMEEVYSLPTGKNCAANQILYNLSRRGPEYELAPWLEEKRIPLMAYSPVHEGNLRVMSALKEVAQRHALRARHRLGAQSSQHHRYPEGGQDRPCARERQSRRCKIDGRRPPPSRRGLQTAAPPHRLGYDMSSSVIPCAAQHLHSNPCHPRRALRLQGEVKGTQGRA
jgi:diketogulonate reductase-like aldo/keto reductase